MGWPSYSLYSGQGLLPLYTPETTNKRHELLRGWCTWVRGVKKGSYSLTSRRGIIPEKHPLCRPIVGMIGSVQALEAIKVVTNLEKAMSGKMIIYDGLRGETRNIKMRGKKPDCKLCGTKDCFRKIFSRVS